MHFKLTDDKKFLYLTNSTNLEFEQLESSLTRQIDNWFFIKKKNPYSDGKIKFMDKYGRVPLGLWNELKNIAKKYKFPIKIEGLKDIFEEDYDGQDFSNWVKEYFKDADKIESRPEQIEAAKKLLYFKQCTEEFSTSGGKTFISFIIFKYLFKKGLIKKMLYVVPRVSLTTQSEEKFYIYEQQAHKRPDWKSHCIYSGTDDPDYTPNIVFGTYHSLAKKDLEFFKDFDSVIIDECHHGKANSIKNLLVKCYGARYKFGLTGTLPIEGSADSFIIQAVLGPKVYDLQSHDLIKSGRAAPVNIISIELNYINDETRKKLYDLRNVPADLKDGSKLLTLEKNMARESSKRLNYITGLISKTNKNSLVLFSDIKNEYGRNIYKWLKENTDKTALYIDGGTDTDNRNYYKKRMEEDENVVMVASIGTFAEGIDIENIHNIFVVESYKDQKIVRQVIGRGMRLKEGKEYVNVFDFCDNFTYNKRKANPRQKQNYLYKHAVERKRVYKDKKFPYKNFVVTL